LELPTDDEEESVLGDFIEDEADTQQDATQTILREHIAEIIKRLTPREAKVLQLRYGLLDGEFYTLDEVGKKYNISRERVRQIEAKALRRLRNPAKQRKLDEYVE